MLEFDFFGLLLQIEAALSWILVVRDVSMHDPILKI